MTITATGQPKFIPAAGTNLLYGTVATTPATAAGPIRKFDNLPEVKVDTWETTQINGILGDGTPDMEKYFEFGKTDNGELSYTIGGDAAVMGTLFGLKGLKKAWLISFTGGTTMAWSGGITGIKFAVGEKDEFTAMITIKVSGGITFTPPSGSGRKPVTISNVRNTLTEADLAAARAAIATIDSNMPPALVTFLQKLLAAMPQPVPPITEAMAGEPAVASPAAVKADADPSRGQLVEQPAAAAVAGATETK